MAKTFGWIQDAGKLSNLKKIMRELIKLGSLSSVESQKVFGETLNIGRWADETYIRLVEALGFTEYDREYDEFIITPLGKRLASSTDEEEIEILSLALLSYPPACRVLQLLKESNEPLSKFEIAENLGFVGESGFTTFGLNNYIRAYHDAPKDEKNKIKSNKESTLDKYARMITNYLIELGWAEKATKVLVYGKYRAETPHTYEVTTKGMEALTKCQGKSRYSKVIKNVSYEMLSSRKQTGSKILRDRRALLLELMNKRKGKLLSFEDIQKYLSKNNSKITDIDLGDDLKKLQNLGLMIETVGKSVVLKENINLNIPIFTTHTKEIQKEIQKMVDDLKKLSLSIDEGFMEKIITEAYSGKGKCKEFEDSVFELYRDSIGFDGIKLGAIGSREPDSLFWYKVEDANDSYGLIVDAKAYSKGFKINTDSSRQMNDYIYSFTKKLEIEQGVSRSHFHWVTSKYIGVDDIEDFSKNVRNMYDFTSLGSIVGVRNSLIMADQMKKRKNFSDLEVVLTLGREITEEDIRKIS